MCQHAQLYNYAIFRELHAIMFLSLSGVSITFANLYILFHAVFIGCPWAWETLGGRYFQQPSSTLPKLFPSTPHKVKM